MQVLGDRLVKQAGRTSNKGKYLSVLKVVRIVYRPLSLHIHSSAMQHRGEGSDDSLRPA